MSIALAVLAWFDQLYALLFIVTWGDQYVSLRVGVMVTCAGAFT